jgi:UDP-N-acetylmuramate--alanine ligase
MQYIKRLGIYPIKVLALFQPHLFSRTKILLMILRKVYLNLTSLLLDIYPARELPMEGITSEWFVGKVIINKKLISKRM